METRVVIENGERRPYSLAEGLRQLPEEHHRMLVRFNRLEDLAELDGEELVANLEETVPETYSGFWQCLTTAQLEAVRRLMREEALGLDAFGPTFRAQLLGRGVSFWAAQGETLWLVAVEEARQSFLATDGKDLRRRGREVDELVAVLWGMLFYYGVVPFDYAGSSLEEFFPAFEGIQYALIEQIVLQDRMEYRDGHLSIAYEDFEEVMDEQASRAGLEYRQFSKTELVKAGQPGFALKPTGYAALRSYLLRMYDVSAEEVDSVIGLFVGLLMEGLPFSEALDTVTAAFDVSVRSTLKKVLAMTQSLYNHTPQWFLKGYAPEELRPASAMQGAEAPTGPAAKGKAGQTKVGQTKVGQTKVGRNEPCPCGSGKKYKRCCGA